MKCKIIAAKHSLSYDYEYWDKRGWLNKDYYLDIRINPFKNLFAKLIENKIKNAMEKNFKQ